MKRLLIVILSLVLINVPVTTVYASEAKDKKEQSDWPEGPDVYAESAIVMEASTGLVLYDKNMEDKRYPASITKIMTALLAIENGSLGEIVTFSHNAIFDVDPQSSRVGFNEGEQLTLNQCLYALLLESDNNAAYAIAEHISGSISSFADLMNQKAKELGCKNTHFVNPHGLPDENHYTCAYDMALITKAALNNETFCKIFGTHTYQIPPTSIQPEKTYLVNHHEFVKKGKYRYDGCVGGKTGYTDTARYTLVTVVKRGDLELICVVMKDDTGEHQYTDTQKLLDFGFENFSIYPAIDLENNEVIPESPLFTRFNPLLSNTHSPLVTDGKGYLVLPNTASIKDAKKEVSFYSDTKINDGGNIVGKISYTYNGKYVGGSNIIYNKVNEITLEHQDTVPAKPAVSPVTSPVPQKEKVRTKDNDLRPIIVGAIVGILILLGGLYYVFVERPRIKRRNAYYKKRKNRNRYLDDDYLDF